jgi:pseudouridine-5'-phosphate glycosidase
MTDREQQENPPTMPEISDHLISIAPEVRAALATGRAVVALESTILAHGFPWPHNLDVAQRCEAAVRTNGAVPATIAVYNHRLRIGLDTEEIAALCRAAHDGISVAKVSRRDLPLALLQPGWGATTVAGTMCSAARVGIRFMATGGIGGVHRGGEQSLDESADLAELARTDMVVVCAGAKTILDIGRTLERLETLGVPILGYQTDTFPGFYVRQTPYRVNLRVDDPATAAYAARIKWELGLHGALVLACPPPAATALPPDEVEQWLTDALATATAQDISGQALTPFLLAYLHQASGGRTIAGNLALVEQNAAIAAQVAVAYAEERRPPGAGGRI